MKGSLNSVSTCLQVVDTRRIMVGTSTRMVTSLLTAVFPVKWMNPFMYRGYDKQWGREEYFQLNREYPLFEEVRSIVSKTIGAIPLIAQSLKKVEGICEAYLYGSFARNQQDAASDIDILLIGNPRSDVLAEAIRKIERQLGREINYTVFSRKEFKSRRNRKDAFLENVWHNKRVSLVSAA